MKNIILIITDTFRYDNLGNSVRTPGLNRFATEKACSIDKFISGSFPTIPHRTDVNTGMLGWPHYGWQNINLSSENRIPTLLGECGYVSQLICDCPHLFNADFNSDFNAAFQHRGQEGDVPLMHLNDKIETVVPVEKTRYMPERLGATLVNLHRWTNHNPRYETECFPAKTSETTVRWLEENYQAGPFFLWVDFFDPHEPWDPPEYLVKRYDRDYEGIPMLHCNYGPSSDYTPEELHNLWAHYAAESELVDRGIGRILQKIDDLGLWDDSIVVVTADHGTSLGEHERTGKSNIHPDDDRYWPLYPEINHVPFLIAGSDIPKGKKLDILAQPIDILPTVCELASADVNPKQPFDGKSFADVLKSDGKQHREYAVSGGHWSTENGLPKKSITPFVTTAKWGYTPVGAEGNVELYDLSVDPLAEKNIADQNPETVSEMHAFLIDNLKQHNAPDDFVDFWKNPDS